MSEYQHCPEGLALYLGAECEFQEYFRNGPPKGGGEWKTTIMKLDSYLNSCFKTIGYKDPILYLRPLSSKTEEEAHEFIKIKDPYVELTDWRRSKSFDLGGWCIKDGEKVWVESFISVGLAKEVKQ